MSEIPKVGDTLLVTEQSIRNGYPHDKENAAKHLKVGERYTAKAISVDNWHTTVWLVEVPGARFNSVNFEVEPHRETFR